MAEAPEPGEYLVKLVMQLRATDPADAAIAFVDRLTDRGMRDWVYRVEDPETDEILGFFDGYGVPVDIEKLARIEEGMTPEALYAQVQAEQEAEGKQGDNEWFNARHRQLLQEYSFLPEDEQKQADAEPVEQPEQPEPNKLVDTVPLPAITDAEESDQELLAVAEAANEGS